MGGDLLGHALAFVAGGADDDDLGPSAATALALHLRRIGRHDDDGRRAQQAGRPGDALRVVAGRIRDDPARQLVGRQRRDGDVGAPQLEGADRLERLGLEEAPRLRRPERDERGPDGDAAEASGGGADVVERDERAERRRSASAFPRREALAVDAARGPGQRLEAFGRDRLPASNARSEGPGIEPRERLVHEHELLIGAIAQGEVALLGEDLAGRRGLRPVRHLAGRDDRLADLLEQAGPLGEKRRADGREVGVHRGW